MFDGIIEIRRAYDNVIVMTGVEDDKLLKLNGNSSKSIQDKGNDKGNPPESAHCVLHIVILDLNKILVLHFLGMTFCY